MRALMKRQDLETYAPTDPIEKMLLATWKKALGGDVKCLQYILELTGDAGADQEDQVYRIELGPGVEELCK